MADILPYYHSSEIVTTSVTERKQIRVWWLAGLLRLTYQGELHWRSAIWTEDWLQEEPAKQSLGEFFREWKIQVPPNRESSRCAWKVEKAVKPKRSELNFRELLIFCVKCSELTLNYWNILVRCYWNLNLAFCLFIWPCHCLDLSLLYDKVKLHYKWLYSLTGYSSVIHSVGF